MTDQPDFPVLIPHFADLPVERAEELTLTEDELAISDAAIESLGDDPDFHWPFDRPRTSADR
jgi:hypothetical protein